MNLDGQLDGIRSRADFVRVAQSLLQDYRQDPGDWENRDIEAYLDAIAAWTEDMDGFYQNQGKPVPQQSDWRLFGQILLAAKYYE
jgi:hypothetical protein